ncbi:MAG TPA: DUF2502 domain-containing protein [Accumulibacter sp.]|uniref:DUF2502 domain-containing protein n=1 Tax=Accumulibacter sp. TaxID=2053492 RepID=UPI0025DCE7FD|nr:DUF2502 domain-containing protein [Accumulibacter sp.]MCM8598935.1 DUF2502 domain-containing protein [Accumulibacter sp.]MCM8663089.1 DUF2502 domain-containing protein [Accumulibacter sp.]HNC52037.1 DUF2502 domain-containing protein [Accumulibacter sp.]
MNRKLACLVLLFAPLIGDAADIQFNIGNVQVNNPPPTRNFGDRDKRGYYWDGKTWRDPGYWERHHGNGNGQGKAKGKGYHCPPGQAKKGNCAPPEPTPYR